MDTSGDAADRSSDLSWQRCQLILSDLVPEPSSIVLAALGLVGLLAWGWRRRNR